MINDTSLLRDGRRRRSSLIIVAIILLATLGFFAALLLLPELVASGLLAYSFGLRHAVDVDHIAAIDNITRKLTTRNGRSPQTVGMFFALGHSSVVFLACCGIILAQHFMNDHMGLFHRYGSVIGSSVSGTFLLIIGVLNLYTARQLWKVWRSGTRGTAENHNEEIMGFCLRCCPRLFRGVSKPWHMLLVGFVFGLGFDTSTEVGLLGIVAVSHGSAQPFTILLLPLLFMSGMCLLDTLNGFFMAWIYRRSLEDEMQMTYFNLFLTTTSGAIALLVALVELLSLPNSLGAHLTGRFWSLVEAANDHFELLGIVVVSIFVSSMVIALCCFRRIFKNPATDQRVREGVLRYVDSGAFIDRSGM